MNHIALKVNGIHIDRDVEDNLRLIDFLRDELYLTGTKEGCSVGECGACTVILDGKAVCSCLLLAAQCNGAEVMTIEALQHDPVGKKLQNAFVRHGGVQCGFCTPGVLMSTKALLDANPNPSDEELKEALEGNLCRCTGYQPIITSIKAVLKS
ncbi:(2Fe-2S)-binding protein [Salmonella enterica subsp. enterica serovar Louisiana]|uniref:(2Fe-2S)-binding protein n=1 Tax=Salmonella enteritidis TaxID=149539 RepID=A0A5V0BV95_SALEN|nr:(2Fe-2S)-binding protein [Salmonella enterica]EBG0215612.1 (2Fe-2S)-binding protein [Salmonella enterica subsp. enterica serovar Louisiana]EBS5460694.1 (2Fe-2S)-binding protein [Salmonella enterica subsp. enterica serovar Enteritidis]EBS5544000.1 (2Fe-2S)-binding protein [Salmonella enterica subsp. enterica serovar Plymouth]ECI3619457.1 (2Fe-2S)-binding protein [Salmonella enterica subsp. enterica]EDW5004549.1 (2Fe-2S)-binding protein [Salmonella enterica subsp. enterica serovar Isangi]EGZ